MGHIKKHFVGARWGIEIRCEGTDLFLLRFAIGIGGAQGLQEFLEA